MKSPARLAATVALALVFVACARADVFYWDADGAASAATGGTGTWNTSSALWRAGNATGTLGAWPTAGGDNDAFFLAGTANTLTLGTGISVNDIAMTSAPGPINPAVIAGGGQTLTLGGSTQPVISVGSFLTLTITSGIAGVNGLNKTSGGRLVLDSASGMGILTGNITVSGGTLQVGSSTNNSSSRILRASPVTLAAGTTLTSNGSSFVAPLHVGNLAGSGSVRPLGNDPINMVALADSTFAGSIVNGGGLNLYGANGRTQTFSGNLTGLTGTIGIQGGATLKLSGSGNAINGVLGSLALAPREGALILDNTAGNTAAADGRIANTAETTLRGGEFALIGNSAGTSETVGGLTLHTGAATISVTHNGGAGGTVLAFTDAGNLRNHQAMTVNFEGVGGTLGASGANPRITFSGAIATGTAGMLSSDPSTVGWATVNGTEWAGITFTGIVPLAPTLTTGTRTGLQGSLSNSITVFNPSANQSLTGAVFAGALKLAPTADSLSLAIGTHSITTAAVMLAGPNDFSITGSTGTLWGGHSRTRYVHVVDADTTLNVAVGLAGADQPTVKSGAGFLNLNGSGNQLNFTGRQDVNIIQGVLRGTLASLGGGTSAGGAHTTLNLFGGVLEIKGGGTFSRALGPYLANSLGGEVVWYNNDDTQGSGGFSAIGGNATVTLVTTVGGSTAAAPVWNTGGFVHTGYALIMGSTQADSRITFTNNIGLDDVSVNNGAANAYYAREVRVIDNVNSTTDVARLSGVITGSINATLLKTGGGVLELTGSNTFAGGTFIHAGTVVAAHNNALGTGTVSIYPDGTLRIGTGISIGNTINLLGGSLALAGGTYAPTVSAGTGYATLAPLTSSLIGGNPDTTATLLSGTTGGSRNLITTFKDSVTAINDDLRISDVLSLTGTGTDIFVLQLSASGVSATSRLGWLDGGAWVNAIAGNSALGTSALQSVSGSFASSGAAATADFLGSWGYDTVNNTVWAVLDHNSDFAITAIPESSAYATLAGFGILSFAVYRRRKVARRTR